MMAMDERETVREKVDMVELVSEYVQLKKAGRNWSGLCPFHAEKTPSFMVSSDLGIFKCFGCGRGGNCYTFLMEIEGVGFGEALKVLAERVGVKLRSWRPRGEEAEREKLLKISRLTTDWYKFLLTKHQVGKKGLEYLLGRGVSRGVIEKFELGWAPEGWENLGKFLVGKRRFAIGDVERAGLVIKGKRGFYDRFRGRVMFPLKNYRGEVVGMAGRVLPGSKGEEGAKYINTPETLIYHKSELLYGLSEVKEEIRKNNRVVVVEGELDMISSWQAGLKEVVAIKGSALTEIQAKRLARIAEKLLLALDMDAAGDRAARRGWRVAEAAGMEVRVVRIPAGKDPDEMARADAKGWNRAVDSAIEVYEFLMESALARHDAGTAMGKRKISAELLPVWAEIEDEVVKAHWVKRLAGKLDIEEKSVWEEMGKKSQKSRQRNGQAKVKSQKLKYGRRIAEPGHLGSRDLGLGRKTEVEGGVRSVREELEKYLWSLVLQWEPERVKERGFSKLFKASWAGKLTKLVKGYLGKRKAFKIEGFEKLVPEEAIDRLRTLNLKEEMAEVKGKLKQAEAEGKEGEAEKLRGRFGKLSGKLATLKR
jgi:DNA primase